MQNYWTDNWSSEKKDFPAGIEPVEIYLASEVDAEREKDKARIAELEKALRRINAINDNPARFDAEIDKLSTVL